MELLSPNPADAYYNLLVQGFRNGHLSLRKDAPEGFARLPDPYDPAANKLYRFGPDRLHDLSYYHGRFYLYFGVTPAVILFWPYNALTGHYLFHRQAVVFFCSIGFLAVASLLWSVWRRYFGKIGVGVAAACVLALGLASGLPLLVSRAEIYEVAVSCSYMLVMLSLGAIWRALHDQQNRCWWLAAASVAYGLAVGSRPELVLGGVVIFTPVFLSWRQGRRDWAGWAATAVPIIMIGLGLITYNSLRFGDPLEFGLRYQLAPSRMDADRHFNPRFVWFHLRAYFMEPVRWSSQFPFVHGPNLPPPPSGHSNVERPFGLLINVPLVWLTLAAPLAWLRRMGRSESTLRLRWFVVAVTVLIALCLLPIVLYSFASIRYQIHFLPELTLLSAIGVLSVECMLIDQSLERRAVRCIWLVLACFSVGFNLLSTAVNLAEANCHMGNAAMQQGRLADARAHYEDAVRLKPDFAEAHINLGSVLLRMNDVEGAIREAEKAVAISPDSAELRNRLGLALIRAGELDRATTEFEQAVRLEPDFAEAHFNLGAMLEQSGRIPEAIAQYEQALRIQPDFRAAQNRWQQLSGAH
jgi:tetratricopeptide (TPR) repeat protein